MSNKAAFEATYTNMRIIQGRKVMQLHFEVAIEKAPLVMEAIGFPQPDEATWVAIALMGKEPVAQKGGKLAQMAGIMCSKPSFWKWIMEDSPSEVVIDTEQAAAYFIHRACQIDSRVALDHNPRAAQAFNQIRSQYEAWLNI